MWECAFYSRTNESEKKYTSYKSLLEILKEKPKKIYYSRKLHSCKSNMKKTWDIVKTKAFKIDIPKRMNVDEIKTLDHNKVANEFSKFFTENGPKLASSNPSSSKDFKQFINVSKTVLQEYTH